MKIDWENRTKWRREGSEKTILSYRIILLYAYKALRWNQLYCSLVNIYSKHHVSYSFVYFSSKRNEWVHLIHICSFHSIPFERREEKEKTSIMIVLMYNMHTENMLCWIDTERSLTLVPRSDIILFPLFVLPLQTHSKRHFERQLKCRNRYYRSISTRIIDHPP